MVYIYMYITIYHLANLPNLLPPKLSSIHGWCLEFTQPTTPYLPSKSPTLSWWISNLPWLLHPPKRRKVPGFHLDESALPTCLEGRRRVSAAAEMAVREEEPQGSLSLVLSQCKFKSPPKMMEICWIMIYSWLLTIWIFQESSKKRLNIEHHLSVENHTQHIVIYCNDHHQPNMLTIIEHQQTLFNIVRPYFETPNEFMVKCRASLAANPHVPQCPAAQPSA